MSADIKQTDGSIDHSAERQRRKRAAQPAAGAEPSDEDIINVMQPCLDEADGGYICAYRTGRNYVAAAGRALLSRYGRPAGDSQPVAWLRKNGFRFDASIEPQDDSEIPLYAAPVAAQKADDVLRRLVDEKFTSGNGIPVERITVTRQEYEAATAQQRKAIAGYDPLEGTGDSGPHEARLLKQRRKV